MPITTNSELKKPFIRYFEDHVGGLPVDGKIFFLLDLPLTAVADTPAPRECVHEADAAEVRLCSRVHLGKSALDVCSRVRLRFWGRVLGP